ncbi:hypothetical protein ACOME3_010063 [Neoechinorhynchus agilis]
MKPVMQLKGIEAMPSRKNKVQKRVTRKGAPERINCVCEKKFFSRLKIRSPNQNKNRSIKEYFKALDLSLEFYQQLQPIETKHTEAQTDVSIPYNQRKTHIECSDEKEIVSQLTSDNACATYWEVIAEKRYDEICRLTEENIKLESIIDEMAEDIINMQSHNEKQET